MRISFRFTLTCGDKTLLQTRFSVEKFEESFWTYNEKGFNVIRVIKQALELNKQLCEFGIDNRKNMLLYVFQDMESTEVKTLEDFYTFVRNIRER